MTVPETIPLKSGNPQAARRSAEQGSDLLPIVTLASWLVVLTIGVTGSVLGYPPPQHDQAGPVIPKTQLVDVALPKATLPPPEPERPVPPMATASDLPTIPQAPAPVAEAQAPALAVALPSPSIAFAVPVEGLTRIVDVGHAAYEGRVSGTGGAGGQSRAHAPQPPPQPSAPTNPATATPPVIHLTLGEGEGNQPPPEYPREAALARQQGTVTLRFAVDETGRVAHVDVVTPSRFALLNQAATRTVRERWHFPPGPPRIFEVPIEFQLNQ